MSIRRTCSRWRGRGSLNAAPARRNTQHIGAGTPGRSVTVSCNTQPDDALGLLCGRHVRDGWWTLPCHCGSWHACQATGGTETSAAVHCRNTLKNTELRARKEITESGSAV